MSVFVPEKPAKTLGQIQSEAAMAQRLINDEVFVSFWKEMLHDASAAALNSTTIEEREHYRVRVLFIAQMGAMLDTMASLPQELRENEERARSFEDR